MVKAYESDAGFIKRFSESNASAKATSLLKVAQSYAGAGRADLARAKYKAVIEQFPGTSYADQAKKAIAALPERRTEGRRWPTKFGHRRRDRAAVRTSTVVLRGSFARSDPNAPVTDCRPIC